MGGGRTPQLGDSRRERDDLGDPVDHLEADAGSDDSGDGDR